MANAFAESLPLIERMKKELEKLGKASQKITEARTNSERNQEVAEQAVTAVQGMVAAHETLVERLAQDHRKGIERQETAVQSAAQLWAATLEKQMIAEVKALRQATELLEKNAKHQHDEISAVANQLQVATGRITAFAEVMNAAKFTTKLEEIDKKQQELAKQLAASNQATSEKLKELAAIATQQQSLLTATAKTAAEERATLRQKINDAHTQQQKQQAEMQQIVQASIAELKQGLKQQLLLKLVLLAGVAAIAVKIFIAL